MERYQGTYSERGKRWLRFILGEGSFLPASHPWFDRGAVPRRLDRSTCAGGGDESYSSGSHGQPGWVSESCSAGADGSQSRPHQRRTDEFRFWCGRLQTRISILWI